ncbi:MAG: GNAT family N-acetyltransferase [Oscillospiraceae bacterium]
MHMEIINYTDDHRQKIAEMIGDDFVREDVLWCVDSAPHYTSLLLCDGEVAGVSAFTSNNLMSSHTFYIDPEYRNRGLGTYLLRETESRMKEAGIKEAMCDFLLKEPELSFVEKRGYVRSFDSNFMRYTGGRMASPEADIIPYQDDFYLESQALVAEAFHEMRLSVAIESELGQPSEADRKHWQGNSGNTFVLRVGDEIVAVLSLGENEIDSLAVRRDVQGRGYGKLMLAYGVNTLLDRGTKEIFLWAVEGNPAKHLYENAGFEVLRLHRFSKHAL